jgi:hypothetical protein
MIALPGKFRIKVFNSTGVTLAAHDVTVKACMQKYDVTAAVSESAVQTLYDNAGTIAHNAYDAGAWFDNTTAHWVGFHGLCYTNTTGAPAGSIKVFLENTTDPAGTSNSPSDGRGWLLIEVTHAAAGNSTRPVKV